MRAAFLPLILAAGLAATAVAATEPAPSQKPAPITDQALAAKLAHDAEIADQDRRSEALNAEVHGKLRAVDARNAATKAAYDKAMADYRAQLAQHDAAAAKVQADYDKSMDAWKAAVAACKAGDVAKCQQAPTAADAAKQASHPGSP